jgi:hypothetical protein
VVDVSQLQQSLAEIEARSAAALSRGRASDGWLSGLRTGSQIALAVPCFGLGLALLSHLASIGVPGFWTLLAWVLLVTALTGAVQALRGYQTAPGRRALLGLVDDRLGLEDRLVAADEFLAMPGAGPFHKAAIADAAGVIGTARAAQLDYRRNHEPLQPHLLRMGAMALGLMLLSALIATTRVSDENAGLQVANAGGGDALAPTSDDPDGGDDSSSNDLVVVPLPQERPPQSPSGATDGSQSEASELDTEEKPSSGKASPGRGGEAKGASGASQARGAPTGKTPEATDPAKRKPKTSKRREQKPGDEPETQKKPEEEDSGSTAGKGSSRGSNKNPVTSSWKSRDQVSTEDNSEVEDDSDSEDEDEEQEQRGGVQPSLRDRRPPVSRDLQIGFGNRPSPDANGRGGPSQPKKSRGVASLVLGVPIPDRVKGRPGPGRTKVTQERVEPEAEEAPATPVEERNARRGPSGGPPPMDLDALTRAVVRAYFLRARSTPQE